MGNYHLFQLKELATGTFFFDKFELFEFITIINILIN